MKIIVVALAPIFALLIYIFVKDKYEKEPLSQLLIAFVSGIIITLPIVFFESIFKNFLHLALNAAVVEEGFKFLAFYLFFWNNKNFNEPFDAIVYSAYISLGFAAVENIIYLFTADNWLSTGILRAIFSVPAHLIFAVSMGFFLAKAKFENKNFFFLALFIPAVFHFLYDFLLSETLIVLFFVLFFITLALALRWIKIAIEKSPFKNKNSLV